ncbi:MAG: hypothetical protein ACKO04_04845 [Actinomycetes bacterium]
MSEQPPTRVRALPWVVVAVTVLVLGLVMVGSFSGRRSVTASPTSAAAEATTTTSTTTTTLPPELAGAVLDPGADLDPDWPTSLTLVTDSVGLGAKDALPASLPGWQVDVRGRPAMMMNVATTELQAQGQPVGSVAVVALGYNSLWGRDRANYEAWSAKFDREADELVATLRGLGAKKVVWVTLREPTDEIIPPDALAAANKYRWFFGYVNERLAALAARDPGVALADWKAVSSTRPGLTYDAIHLRPVGAQLYSETVKSAVGVPPASVPGLPTA